MSNLIDVGQLTAAHGIKGWLKVHSQTEPTDNIFYYQPWYLKTRHGVHKAELLEWRAQGKGFVARIKGVDDRNQAEAISPVTIAIEKNQLPELVDGEYYWHQLKGCRVISLYDHQVTDLGLITRMMSTGANDVLVVKGDAESVDFKERLVPYVPEQFIKEIDLPNQVVKVDWDPEF